MRVLVACEYSATVRDQFRGLGHEAWSVDILTTEGDPAHHIQGDALEVAYSRPWDLMVAFPPCTYLTKSNAWRWAAIQEERLAALQFVRTLMAAPISRIAVENPSGAIGTHIRKADQYIQPWHFGDPYQKMTGLWLKNLPLLVPETASRPLGVTPWAQGSYGGKVAGVHRSGHERSRTFPGIARAMAIQWNL